MLKLYVRSRVISLVDTVSLQAMSGVFSICDYGSADGEISHDFIETVIGEQSHIIMNIHLILKFLFNVSNDIFTNALLFCHNLT